MMTLWDKESTSFDQKISSLTHPDLRALLALDDAHREDGSDAVLKNIPVYGNHQGQ